MQKKLLTVVTFSRDSTDKSRALLDALAPYSDKIEVICHLDNVFPAFAITNLSMSDYGRFIKTAAALAKGAFVVLIPPQTHLNAPAFEQTLKLLENTSDSIIHFSKSDLALCSAIDTKLFKNICKSSAEVQLTDIPLHCFVAATSVRQVPFVPFITGNEIQKLLAADKWETYTASLLIAVRTFNSPRKRVSTVMYKSAFDAIFCSLEAAYFAAIKKVCSDKKFAVQAANFDDKLKAADPKMYDYIANHFDHASLEKLRESRFTKIPLLTKLHFMFRK